VQASCRLTHIPTGVTVTSQTRSRTNSLDLAKKEMLKRLTETELIENNNRVSLNRKLQVGTGQRGDKIRTYQLNHDIATDHRTGIKCSAKKILSGNFDLLW
jgi:peptide chain release factor 1